MTKKKASAIAARIRRVKLTPADKLERTIDDVRECEQVEEETNEKVIEYAVDLQYGMKGSFRELIEEIQKLHRPEIPQDRQFELAETSLSLLVAHVCLAERLRASR